MGADFSDDALLPVPGLAKAHVCALAPVPRQRATPCLEQRQSVHAKLKATPLQADLTKW